MDQTQSQSTDQRVTIVHRLMKGGGATTRAFSKLSPAQISLFHVKTAEELENMINQILSDASPYNPQLSAVQNALGLGGALGVDLTSRRYLYIKNSFDGSLRTLRRREVKGVDELLRLIDTKPAFKSLRPQDQGELMSQLAIMRQENLKLKQEVIRLTAIISKASKVLSVGQ